MAVIVTGIKADLPVSMLFTQALLYVTADAWLAGNKKMALATNASRPTTDRFRRLNRLR